MKFFSVLVFLFDTFGFQLNEFVCILKIQMICKWFASNSEIDNIYYIEQSNHLEII